MAKPPVSQQVQVNFRMPADLRDRIKAAAEAVGQSMNHIIVAALEERYPGISGIDRSVERALDGITSLIREVGWDSLTQKKLSEIVRKASLANNLDPACFEATLTEGWVKLRFDHPLAESHTMVIASPTVVSFSQLIEVGDRATDD